MTKAQQSALVRFKKGGGTGTLDRYGRMVTDGQVISSVDCSTWLRLVLGGYIDAYRGRFRLTMSGNSQATLFAKRLA